MYILSYYFISNIYHIFNQLLYIIFVVKYNFFQIFLLIK